MKILKTVLFKISVYFICVIMISGGWYMVLTEPNYSLQINNAKQPIAGFGLIIIGLMYPVTDILINLKKKK